MSNGGYRGLRRVPTVASAPGVWDMGEIYNARQGGIWPYNVLPVSGAKFHLDASNPSTLTMSGANVEQLNCLVDPANRQLRRNSTTPPTLTTVNGLNAINIAANQWMWIYDNTATTYSAHTLHIVMRWLTGDYPILFGGLTAAATGADMGKFVGFEGGANGGASDNLVDYFAGFSNDLRISATGVGARNSNTRQWSIGTSTTNTAASCRVKHNNVTATLSNLTNFVTNTVAPATMNFKLGHTSQTNADVLSGKFPYNNSGTLVLCELVLYDRLLSDAEMTLLYDFLKIKWGTL